MGLHRRAGVVRPERLAVPTYRLFDVARGVPCHRKGLGHRAHAAPLPGVAVLQAAHLALAFLALPGGGLGRLGAVVARAHGQAFQRQRQADGRRQPFELVPLGRGAGRGGRPARDEDPVGVAVALVGCPGLAARRGLPCRQACCGHGFDKGLPGQQRAVEGLREHLGRPVVHRPPGGHHAAHADLDQRLGHARRKGHRFVDLQRPAAVDLAQVAAVDEYQLGHVGQFLDLVRTQEHAIGQHHPAARDHGLLLGVHLHRRAVAGDVHDAVGPRHQGHDDGVEGVGVDQRRDAVRRNAPGPGELLHHGPGLAERAGQGGVVVAGDQGLADHQHGGVGIGVARALAEVGHRQLAQQFAAYRPGQHGGLAAAGVALRVQQFPGNGRRAGVELQHDAVVATEEGLELQRHQQLEQGAAQLGVARARRGRQLDELAHQLGLGALGAHLGARAARVQREGDGVVAGGGGADEVVVGAAVPGLGLAPQRAGAAGDGGRHLIGQRAGLGQQTQAAPGVARAVQVQLHQGQLAHLRPGRARQALVGQPHALRNGARRGASRHAQAAASYERGGQFDAALARAVQTPLAVFAGALGPGLDTLAHRFGQLRAVQRALLAQADHDGGHRARQLPGVVFVLPGVQEDALRARRVRVQPGLQRRVHGPAQVAVDDVFGAGEFQRAVMPQHQRLAHEGQVAVEHLDLQPGLAGAGAGLACVCQIGGIGRRAAHDVADAPCQLRRRGAPGRAAAQVRQRRGAIARGCQWRQPGRGAADQQVGKGVEGLLRTGQAAVFAVQRPGRHARHQGRRQRHTTVAAVLQVQVHQALAAQLEAVGGGLGVAHHQAHLAGAGLQRAGELGVELGAQRACLVQHGLRRHAPLVGGGGHLTGVTLPPVAFLFAAQVVLGQLLPGAFLVQPQARVQQPGLQLQEAGHARHQVACPAGREGRPDGRQRVAEGVVARQHLHRRPRAAVGRAQHQQPRVGVGHQPGPHIRRHQLHGAGQQAAHGVGQHTHRFASGLAGVQRLAHAPGQAQGFFFQRAAPVVAEGDDLVGGVQVVQQLVVDQADRAVVGHLVSAPGLVGQAVESAQQPRSQPDAVVARRQPLLEVAAQDAGQHEHGRLVGVRRAPGGAPFSAGVLAGPGQRAYGLEVRRRPHIDQRVHHRIRRLAVAEVVEVRGLGALVEQVAAAARARRAAVHRARLHDDVVVSPVVRVGQQRLQPAAHGAAALQVAGHDAQVAGQGLRRGVEPLQHRSARNHGRQPGDHLRVGTAPRHFGHQVHEGRHHRHAGEFQRPLQHRQVRVQPLAGQQGAACRAGHAHHPLHAQPLALDEFAQTHQFSPLRLVGRIAEEGQVVLAHAVLPDHARQHLGHQAAARMRGQVQPGAVGQGLDQRARVGDGAGGQGRVVQRVHGAAVMLEQALDTGRVLQPELLERAAGVDKRAVHKHQDRVLAGVHPGALAVAALELFQPVGLQGVHAGVDLLVHATHHLAGDKVDRLVLDQPGQHLEGRDHDPAHVRHVARGGVADGTGPRQLDLHRHVGRAALAAASTQHQVARRGRVQQQHRAVLDVQRHDVFIGYCRHAHRSAAVALRAHPHGSLHLSGQRGGRRGPAAGGAGRGCPALARNGKGDG